MPIKQGDYILITDRNDVHYLDIGEVEEVDFYPGCDDVKSYHVHFASAKQHKVDADYNSDLIYQCKVLEFRRR